MIIFSSVSSTAIKVKWIKDKLSGGFKQEAADDRVLGNDKSNKKFVELIVVKV